MYKMLILSMFCVSFLMTDAMAINRISNPIAEMEELLEKYGDKNNPAQYLVRSKARILAFQVQALGRLYKKEERGLRKVRDSYKAFEDGIGELKKWIELLDFAKERGAKPEKIKYLEGKVKKSELEFNTYLEKKEWLSGKIFKDHKKQLKFLDELSDEKERKLSLSLVRKSLEKVEKTDFDLSYLEEGNGLHEFRRELRWQLYQIVNLGGLIDYNMDRLSCSSLEDYDRYSLRRANKYTKIKKRYDEQSCYVDYCLMNEMALMVSSFGDIKDEVEGLLNTTGVNDDRTPAPFLVRAEKLRSEWDNKNVLPVLIEKIKDCE